MLSQQQKAAIDAAITASRTPRRVASNRTVLSTGQAATGAYQVLVGPNGAKTPAGQDYYDKTGHSAPNSTFDHNQDLIRKGPNDYIRTRNNKMALVKTLLPSGGVKLTALGKQFFKEKHNEFVVSVPVVIRGHRTRRRGPSEPYTHAAYLPVDMLGIGRIMANQGLSHAQQVSKVNELVQQQMNVSDPDTRRLFSNSPARRTDWTTAGNG